jgi:hypothetical protein
MPLDKSPITDHNPGNLIGQAFCWEKAPGDRVQEGGGAGVSQDTLRGLYQEGIDDCKAAGGTDIECANGGYDSIKEGAGLGYLLPTQLIGSFPEADPHILFDNVGHRYAPGNPDIPYLGACFTLPGMLAEFSETPYEDNPDRWEFNWGRRCNFQFPRIEEDNFEEGGRNDSYFTAKKIEWGPHNNLTIDKIAHIDYLDAGYARYTSDVENTTYNILPEADYDYYYLNNGDLYNIRVDIENHTGHKWLIVDGEKTWVVENRSSSISVPGKAMHTIMVSGNMGNYSLNVTPVILGDLDGDGDVDRNDINIIIAHRNQPASACPECDIDGDGTITVLDARKLILMCTRPRCAVE